MKNTLAQLFAKWLARKQASTPEITVSCPIRDTYLVIWEENGKKKSATTKNSIQAQFALNAARNTLTPCQIYKNGKLEKSYIW